MSIGMTYEDFWFGDASMVRAYRRADELRKRRQNEMLWLQGMYVYEALCDASPLFRTSFSKKAVKPEPYAKEPYAITAEEIREREEREARLAQERIKAEFAAFAARMQKKMPQEAHPVITGGEINERSDKH